MSHSLGLRLPLSIETALHPLIAYASRNRTFLTLLLAPPVLHRIYGDYSAYCSLGPGGLPHNAIGWLISSLARLVARETLSTGVYAAPSPSFISTTLHPRRGLRPKTGSHPIPHRQVDQIPARDMVDALQSAVLEIHASFFSSTSLAPSRFEKHGDALFIHPEVPTDAVAEVVEGAHREVAHVHETDGSCHMLIASHADCVEVIEKGWGERHPLAGRLLPKEYLMVYAPRDWGEVGVVRGIVEAAVRAAVGREGKDVPGGWN